jgi:predicted phage terminase large subunit-like protein
LERQKDWKVLRYPAVAEQDEPHRKKGQALFPELKPLDFLLQRKAELTEGSWQALYQQSPIIVGGGAIPIEKLRVLPQWDRVNNKDIKRSVRYIDKSATVEDGAYTAGVLMHLMNNKTYVISHIFRGQWSALEREDKIRMYCDADKKLLKTSYEVVVEQEPGSGGKESAEATIRNLAGMKVTADKVTGSKEVRAEPFLAQCQGDNVRLVAGDWVMPFIDECETWPAGKYKDQVDAAAGAFNKLVAAPMYTLEPFQPGFIDYDRRTA